MNEIKFYEQNTSWFTKGHIPWNKGLSKENDPRMAKISTKIKVAIRKRPKKDSKMQNCMECGKFTYNLKYCSKHCFNVNASSRMKENWANSEYRNQQVLSHIGKTPAWKNIEQRNKNLSIGTLKSWTNNEKRKTNQSIVAKDNTTRLWKDPNFVQKQIQARIKKPNGGELFLLKVLNQNFDSWKYVGDGSFMVGRKNPDFWNGDHKLIELFGDYWHKAEDEADRTSYFSNYGYKVLIIWASEFQSGQLLQKIRDFCNE